MSRLPLTDTQAMLCDSLGRYLSEQYSLEQRLHLLDRPKTEAPLWRALSHELGLLGAGFAEEQGGLGGDLRDQFAIMETLGRHLAAEPYLSTVVIGGGLLRRLPCEPARRLLGRLLDGEAVLALGTAEPQSRDVLRDVQTRLTPQGDHYVLDGRKAVVHSAPWATDLLITARLAGAPAGDASLSLVHLPAAADGLTRRDYSALDGGHASDLAFKAVKVQPEQVLTEKGNALPLLQQVFDEATLAVCAEALGVLDRLLLDTVDYVKQRRQFGVPIASFQALQHRLADMYVALEQAAALTASTADVLDDADLDSLARARAVSSLKICVSRACRIVGQGAVQMHGGMGMTEELAIGHYFRRATQIEQLFGSIDHHLRRVERLTAAAPA